MLALIKEKMKELEVDYEYFDGSTSAPDREKAIQRFQNDENCRVFLISLKAGWCWFEPNSSRLCLYR
jgi:SNF2 family DNA or RNA helicase